MFLEPSILISCYTTPREQQLRLRSYLWKKATMAPLNEMQGYAYGLLNDFDQVLKCFNTFTEEECHPVTRQVLS
jgi:hypothetical protein